MKSLQDILEGILGDIDKELDVPTSIGGFIMKLKQLHFKCTYKKPLLRLYSVRHKDSHETFYSLWSIIQKDSISKIRNINTGLTRGENCTVIALVTSQDNEQHIIIYNPSILDVLLITARTSDPIQPSTLEIEMQAGKYCLYSMDYIAQSQKKMLYKFPAITYELIKSSIS